MIFVRDKGQMCNNILQYGHVFAWGKEHGRTTMSMRFAYKYRYFHICHTRYHNFFVYLYAKYAAKLGLLKVADFGIDAPNDPEHQEQLLFNHQHIVAEGWYARWYDLFLKYKQEIIDLFQFDECVRETPTRLLESQPQSDLRLGVHIRRGDYHRWHGGQYYYNDLQYISVIRQFINLHPDLRIQLFICGNDPELNEALFHEAFPTLDICFPKGNPGEDLYLLSRCDRMIGPPSTFTLVASMYRDVPLYWIESADHQLKDSDFGHFDQLFKQIK